MANIASVLKSEISRIARKELRPETAASKKALATTRSEIAALKRRSAALEQQVKRLMKLTRVKDEPVAEDPESKTRFSAKGFATQRRRLALSAESMGQLLGTSGQTVYNWEQGKARPRSRHLAAIAALRTLNKKSAAAHVAAARGATQ